MTTADRHAVRWSAVLVAVVTVALLVLPFIVGARAGRLLDRHSDPRPRVTVPGTVAVVSSGKLYHDPRCTFIHGRVELEPVSAAIEKGFTPCPRCLGVLRTTFLTGDGPGAERRAWMTTMAGSGRLPKRFASR